MKLGGGSGDTTHPQVELMDFKHAWHPTQLLLERVNIWDVGTDLGGRSLHENVARVTNQRNWREREREEGEPGGRSVHMPAISALA